MVKKIDARGLACPQPVVLTKKTLDGMVEGKVEVIVDNKSSSENVSRLARSSGCKVDVKQKGENFVVKIEKTKKRIKKSVGEKKTISIFVRSDTVGKGNDDLGGILIRAFFPTLLEIEPRPNKLIFMNAGVKLTVEGSQVIDSLKNLEKEGIELLVCGTCLDFFRVKDKIRVGRISNMFEIVESLINADRIISI